MKTNQECFKYFANLINYLHDNGYHFMRFEDVQSDSYKINEKQVVLRFDIHLRDLNNTPDLFKIEESILGFVASTSFVMFGLQGSTSSEFLNEYYFNSRYDAFVASCVDDGIEVQPHISPINDYIHRFQPDWMSLDEAAIARLLVENYHCQETPCGLEFSVKNKDVFNLEHINNAVAEFIQEYLFLWRSRYGFLPKGFAVHGNSIPMNRIIHNGVLINQLNIQKRFQDYFEVHSSAIREKLDLYSDCTIPRWMWQKPNFKSNNLQLLVHPARWSDSVIDGYIAKANQLQIENGNLLYPYATPLDTIINPVDFINSGLSRYEYSLVNKSSSYQ